MVLGILPKGWGACLGCSADATPAMRRVFVTSPFHKAASLHRAGGFFWAESIIIIFGASRSFSLSLIKGSFFLHFTIPWIGSYRPRDQQHIHPGLKGLVRFSRSPFFLVHAASRRTCAPVLPFAGMFRTLARRFRTLAGKPLSLG